ncbi:MAG TPA: DUF5615 family PIN-like protein [Armatimonadota bacterium]|nr:DUF5615 family PIN-like protein [Armatimonadota bacterium]
MRLLLDHHISKRVAATLQQQGYDVITAADAGVARVDDDLVWIRSIELGRVVVTYNYCDFLQLYDQFYAAGRHHPGLVIVYPNVIRTSDIGGLIRALVQLLRDDPDLTDVQHYLQPAEQS